MVSATEWRKNRKITYTAPSGDKYLIERPDPISLTQFWMKDCDMTEPIGEKDLSKQILENPAIIEKMLIRYVLEPKITAKGSEQSLAVKELMIDQTDCIAIIREILHFFLTNVDEVLSFFRTLKLSSNSR